MLSAMIGLCSGLIVSFSAPSLAKPSWSAFYEGTARQAELPAGTLIKYERLRLPAFYRAKAWRILYATRDYRNRPLLGSGVAVLPDYAAKMPQDRTIVAFAHPTVGVARHCAPSARKNPTAAILGLNELVSSGHIVVAADYPGLGTYGPIGYLIGLGQSHAVIDSVRAARQVPGVGGGNRFALWGYSQGGHAALFAAMVSGRYAPELKSIGVAAAAPPTDLGRLLIADLNTLEGRILTSFTLGSWAVKYGFALESLVNRQTVGIINDINTNCIDDFAEQIDTMKAQKQLGQQFLVRNPLMAPGWRDALTDNSLFSFPNVVPALILQGESDRIVHAAVTLNFVRSACRNGAKIKYESFKAKGHGGVAKASIGPAVSWINDRFKGRPVPVSCR
jgi:alpha-beta hydrolase superfamily lysophospholipase